MTWADKVSNVIMYGGVMLGVAILAYKLDLLDRLQRPEDQPVVQAVRIWAEPRLAGLMPEPGE